MVFFFYHLSMFDFIQVESQARESEKLLCVGYQTSFGFLESVH